MLTRRKKTLSIAAIILVVIFVLTSIITQMSVFAAVAYVTDISAGNGFTLLRYSDGTVYSIGYNKNGELGINSQTNQANLTQTINLSSISDIKSKGYSSIALTSAGEVYLFGNNFYGQLGTNDTIDALTPTKIEGLSNISKIEAGVNNSFAIESDGTLWAIGSNMFGQIGDGKINDRHLPVEVKGITNVTDVASGYYHTLILDSSGDVYTVGNNCYGQLGNNDDEMILEPEKLTSLSNVSKIAAGYAFSVVLKSDGTVWAFGDNSYGTLGNGSNTLSRVPVQVSGASSITNIACGKNHVLLLKSDGTVYSYGYNVFGQLGNGNNTNTNTPAQISSLSGITGIAAGEYSSYAYKADGTVYAFGANGNYQLMDGTTTNKNTPVTSILTKVPYVPQNVEYIKGYDYITISWEAVPGASAYDIEFDSAVTQDITGTSYTFSSLTPSSSHSFRVKAVNDNNDGEYGSIVNVSLADDYPDIYTTTISDITVKNVQSGAVDYVNDKDVFMLSAPVSGNYVFSGAASNEVDIVIKNDLGTTLNSIQKVTDFNLVIAANSNDEMYVEITGHEDNTATYQFETYKKLGDIMNLSVTENIGDLNVSWDNTSTAYEIKINDGSPSDITTNSFVLSSVTADQWYKFEIRSEDSYGYSNYKQIFGINETSPWIDKNAGISQRTDFDVTTDGIDIYITGGIDSQNNYLSSIEKYSVATNSVTTLTPFTTSRKDHTVTCDGTKLYIIGGEDSSQTLLSSVEIYDLATETILSGAAMSVGIKNHSATYDNGKIYVIGGEDSQGVISTVNIYDIATDSWSTGTSMSTARKNMASVNGGFAICVIGGENSTSKMTVNEAYIPSQDTWYSLMGLSTGLSDFGLELGKNGLYIIAGNSEANAIADVQKYLIDENTYISQTGTLVSGAVQSISIDGDIYIVKDDVYMMSPKSDITFNLTENNEYAIAFEASDITSVGQGFTVKFNPNELEIVDLCSMTEELETTTTTGMIEGTNVSINAVLNGEISFIVTRPLNSGENWSGCANMMTFKALDSGTILISFDAQ